jgi:hypothetical protein
MAKSMELEVVVRLRDLLSRGVDTIGQKIRGLGDRVRDLARNFGTLGGALSLSEGLRSLVEFDTKLRDIAITAGKVGDEVTRAVADMRREFEALTRQTGQTSMALGTGAGILQSSGMTPERIRELVRPMGRFTTATGAEMTDSAKLIFALDNVAKIRPEQMDNALAGLTTQGKEGRFEVKDMPANMPRILTQFAQLGMTGPEAVNTAGAALQIAMLGASDPAIAANNAANFLQKINQKDTIKNFDEAGIDIVKRQQEAMAKGINPFEAVLAAIQEVTKVSDADIARILADAGQDPAKADQLLKDRIGQIGGRANLQTIFGDAQVLDFLGPMLLNMPEYRRIKAVGQAADVSVLDKDFESRMAGAGKQIEMIVENLTQTFRKLADGSLPLLAAVENLTAGLNEFVGWMRDNLPGVTKVAIAAAGGAAVVKGAQMAGGAVSLLTGGGAGAAAVGGGTVSAAGGGVLLPAIAGGALIYGAYDVGRFLDERMPRIAVPLDRDIGLPLEPGMIETSYRNQKDRERDPEGYRGRAMQRGAWNNDQMQPQKVDVGGQITIRVEGPGAVTAVSSTNPNVPLAPDRGASVLRP